MTKTLEERATEVAELRKELPNDYVGDWYSEEIRSASSKVGRVYIYNDVRVGREHTIVCEDIGDSNLSNFIAHAPHMAQLIADMAVMIKKLEDDSIVIFGDEVATILVRQLKEEVKKLSKKVLKLEKDARGFKETVDEYDFGGG